MPTARKQKRTQKKGRGNRGRGGAPAPVPMVTKMPSSRRVIMTYSTNSTLVEGAAGGGASYFYRLNSPYDPDQSGIGTTATGYSTFAAVFLNYKIHRVTARIRGLIAGITTGAGSVVVAPVARQAVVPSNPVLWRSMRGAKADLLAPAAVGGHNQLSWTITYDLASVLEVTKSQFRNDMDFSGAVGSNPAREAFLMISIQSTGVGTPGQLLYSLDLSYEVEWFNPVPLQL